MGGINIWRLLIIAVIVILLFGTRKLSTLGSDLGSAIKGFKKAMSDGNDAGPSVISESTERLEEKKVSAGAAADQSSSAGRQA